MNKDVERLFTSLPESKLRVALLLREIILGAQPGISETIKWGRVTFCHHSTPVAFLCMHNGRPGVELGFFHDEVLNNTAVKKRTSKRVQFTYAETLPADDVQSWILKACKVE